MKSTARRYASPATPPRLVVVAVPGAAASTRPPVLCLRCGGEAGHAAPRLVGFGWSRMLARR